MSKDDFETNRTLLNPYIEVEKREKPNSGCRAYVNVSAFEECLGKLVPPATDDGPNISEGRDYCIYGVVGRTVTGFTGAYLNVDERPISRTFMGFISNEVLKDNLPKTHKILNQEE